ncbi:MAG: nucleotidyltransferase family protein, partial [Clostridia bacterium]|nr:nucleotidyltransferase family protein [Clostridia bacterium]
MKAVIMAGGEGQRLRPITCTQPKPMAELLNRPTMEYCVRLLKQHGLKDITATLHYIPNAIKDYFGDGSAFGVKMSYSVEDEPMGKAGSVRYAVVRYAEEGEEVFVISGD